VTDRDALLRAICDSPDDDAPRLVYADWLDENGDPRQAEFIRVQIALAGVPEFERATHPGFARVQELWRELRKWRYPLGDWRLFVLSHFFRGFNVVRSTTVRDFMTAAAAPWTLGTVEVLSLCFDGRLDFSPAKVAKLTAIPALGRMKVLRLHGSRLTDDWVAAVVSSPSAAGWRHLDLDLYGRELSDPLCDALCASPLVTSKATIEIHRGNLSDRGRVILCDAFEDRQTIH
jgi:uncharacterized protein (TIGR02996 family)